MTTLFPIAINVDTTGDYDIFLHGLIARMPEVAGPGDIHFVIHEDENKILYVPRNYGKKEFSICVNAFTIENMRSELEVQRKSGEFFEDDCRQLESLLMLATPRAERGQYVIWENPQRCLLIQTPKTTLKDALNRELERRRAAKGGFG